MFITPPHRDFVSKEYVDKQGVRCTKDDVFEHFTKEQLIEMIGIDEIQAYLRKKKIEKIINK